MPYIYKITNNVNEKVYIGKTLKTVSERWAEHQKDYLRREYEHRPLYSAMKKYGLSCFTIEQIEECSAQELNDRETYWIEFYGSFKYGYNATKGGDGRHYLDYDLIYRTFLSCGNIAKTAKILGYDKDTVSKVVKMNGDHIVRGGELARKPVARLDKKTGEILEVLESTRAADSKYNTGKHVAEVCNGKRKSAGGFGWKFI